MFSTMFMTGRRKDSIICTLNCVSTRWRFASEKRPASAFSWTKALTTRMPDTFSWMMLLSRSRLSCSTVKRGFVRQTTKMMSIRISGNAHATITPKLRSSRSSAIVPPTKNITQRTSPRISCMISC